MDVKERPQPSEIRQARQEKPKMRERDFAASLGISEAEFAAAYCGEGVRRIEPRVSDVLMGLEALGEVMALTRNESAVHEKIGVYDKVGTGESTAIVLGEQINLRIFPRRWVHAFAVEKRDGEDVRRSLQFFDAAGDAVHKVHLRPASDVAAYEKLVASLLSPDQKPGVVVKEVPAHEEGRASVPASAIELRKRWQAMTSVHQIYGLLNELNLGRLGAFRALGEDIAWPLATGSIEALFEQAVAGAVPIMVFVGSRGCVQIHAGPVANIKPMGPWLNVMDETFHLHLRLDHIAQVWAVRKPTEKGHVTSVEAFDAQGNGIIQFFGSRHEGEDEIRSWRTLAESLPRHDKIAA